jgi:hypothetical protein
MCGDGEGAALKPGKGRFSVAGFLSIIVQAGVM